MAAHLYSVAKAAVIHLTKSVALELGEFGIRVNCICPGFIQGDWLEQGLGSDAYQAAKASVEASSPLQVACTPDMIAEGILYFVCGADVVTGETIIMDGGMHLAQAGLSKR